MGARAGAMVDELRLRVREGDMAIDSKVKKVEPPGSFEILAGGGLAAVVIFSVGVFMMVVPLIGWVVGPALMIVAGVVAVVHMGQIFRRKAGYAGNCPYCGAPTVAGEPGSVGECHACWNKFVHRDNQLWKTA